MQSSSNLEQVMLDQFRILSIKQQQEVIDFAAFLRHRNIQQQPAPQLSLTQLAALPLDQRHQYLAALVPAMASDFTSDRALTEFEELDSEDWDVAT